MGLLTASASINATIDGNSIAGNISITGDASPNTKISVPVAWGGTLTTRTDDDTGTLTMTDAGHLITTGAVIDLYWSGGTRRRVVVGTVSGTSVPFGAVTVGAGDNLPIATTAIVAAIRVVQELYFTVANVLAVGVSCDYECQVCFMEADGTTEDLYQHVQPATNGQPSCGLWFSGFAFGASPFTGTTVTQVYMTHGDTAAAHDITIAVLTS